MKASDVKFGVEVECYLPTGTIEALGGYHHGLQVAWLPNGWNGQSDSSLSHCPDGYRAAEIVSPILSGEEGLAQVWFTLEAIKELNGVVNNTCGLHVHVDGRTLTSRNVKDIKAAFVTYEKAFYGLSGTEAARRFGSTYCRNSSQWGTDETNDRADRYRSLNLTNWHNLDRKKTVEVRVWAGTLEAERVVTAVYMAVALVVSVVNGTCKGTGSRIENPTQAAKQFVGQTFVNPAARIVDDCTVNEVTRTLLTACKSARF